MKTALALGGGGAKGAYEVGALCALKELGIDFDIVTGTSIGSLNGFFWACSEIEKLDVLWSNISMDQVLRTVNFDDGSLDFISLSKHLKSAKEPNYEVHPLKSLIDLHVNEDKIRASEIDFGLVCVSFPSLKPLELPLCEIPHGKLADYLLASCSVFPAFPMCKIDEKLYIDGGFYDNVPINLAIKMGAEYVIAIDIFNRPAHPEYIGSPLVKYIKTSWDLSYMLLFNKESVERNRALGYNETLKAFDKLLGFRYSFEIDSFDNYIDFSNKFSREILIFESFVPAKNLILRKFIANPLSKCLREYTESCPSIRDFFIRGIEICMEFLKYDPTIVYDISTVNTEILEVFADKDTFKYADVFRFANSLSPKIDKIYLIGCILYKLVDCHEFTDEFHVIANIFPRETTSALYIYTLMT